MNESTDMRAVKIGEMLIAVGVLSTGDLTEAIQISRRMGVPIGRVLVMSGCVSESSLKKTLELQSLLKDELVDLDTAYSALKLVLQHNMEVDAALKQLNWKPKQDQTSNKLGDLLVDSTIVSRTQLEKALETSFQSGMPLGGTLVLQGVLSAQLLPTVLNVQERIREGTLSRSDAMEELKRALMFWAKAEMSKQTDSLAKAPPGSFRNATAKSSDKITLSPKQKLPIFEGRDPYLETEPPAGQPGQPGQPMLSDNVSLIELLKLSGFCTQGSLEKAVDEALQDGRLLSKLLLAIGFIDAATLNQYIHLQALIARGKLRTDQAIYVLTSMKQRNLSLEQALAEMGVASGL